MPDASKIFQVPIMKMPEQPPRVAIVFCSHDRVHAGWSYDYSHLVGHFIASGGYVPETGEKFALSFNWCQTSLLPEGRWRLVEDLKAKGVAKALWIDTDMRFPRQTLHMLLRHGKPIVGANYVSRRPPFRWTAADKDLKPMETRPGMTHIEEASHIGFGCILTDMSVFPEAHNPDVPPCFEFRWYFDHDERRWKIIGEDVWFARYVIERGEKLYVDHELSNACSHTGEFDYTPEVLMQVTAQEQQEKAAQVA